MITFLILILLLIGAMVFLVCPQRPSDRQREPFRHRYIAHRGLHTSDGIVPENSISAFRRAFSAGYGAEFDLQLSSDGTVMVFHDDDLYRMCGVHGKIEETPFEELRRMRLANTDEIIPTFDEVLKVCGGSQPLIIELKKSTRNAELCRKTYERLKSYSGEYCIESFDPRIVSWFRKNAPEIYRGQLITSAEDYKGFKKPLALILSNGMLNFLGRPNFIAHNITKKRLGVRIAEALGAVRICWVARDPSESEGNETSIFEFFEPDPKY
ncbi:MAG: glycerophosphodiester phosphodiesterase [Firmicutes bacterium]|nr:glycerophosphodiester phosphodiesterase [Bacillota bacterium]